MKLISYLKKVIENPFKPFGTLAMNVPVINHNLSDRVYLKVVYRSIFHRKLNLTTPKLYTEKLQWLKLYNRKDIYTKMVDKYEVKDYVAKIIGNKHILRTLGVWNSFDDIDFSTLPNQFVLKCTHDSGGLVICKDKNDFNFIAAKQKINTCLKNKFFYQGREWPYKNVIPRIIAEEYVVDESGVELKDYKFFCFNGKAKVMFLASDRGQSDEETKFDFFDMNFKHLPIKSGHPNSKVHFEKPKNFELMKQLAEQLALDLPHARIDFYDVNGEIYFGEITFFHWSGFVSFEPQEWDYKFGEWLVLPKEKVIK